MANELQLSPLWEGLIVAAALLGILVGSPLGGWASDKWGRKPLFTFDIAVFTVASAMQFFIDAPILLLVARLLMGVAIGVEYSVGWPLMSEFAPARLRGRFLGAMNIAWYGGFMLAYLLGYLLNGYSGIGWRFILGPALSSHWFCLSAGSGCLSRRAGFSAWAAVTRPAPLRGRTYLTMPSTTSNTRTCARAASQCCFPDSTGGQPCLSRVSGSAPWHHTSPSLLSRTASCISTVWLEGSQGALASPLSHWPA
jgi:MFS family permease